MLLLFATATPRHLDEDEDFDHWWTLGQNATQDYSTCSEKWCTSPALEEGEDDCYAGSAFEPCSCEQGSALTTGLEGEYDGNTYYHYVCCLEGGDGEVCGDYIGHWFWAVFLTIFCLIVVGSIVGCCVCYRKKTCCWSQYGCCAGRYPNSPVSAAPPMAMPMQSGQVVQGTVMEMSAMPQLGVQALEPWKVQPCAMHWPQSLAKLLQVP